MKFEVFVISDAEKDIIDIYKYIIFSDSKEKAEYVFHKIEETCKSFFPYLIEAIFLQSWKELE